MDAITSIIPTPKPLLIAAAGITVQVSEFTLRDLADLQSILDARHADPLLEIGEDLEVLAGDDRRKLLVWAWEQADAGPGVYGDPSGAAWFTTTAGRAAIVWAALRRHNQSVTPEQAAILLGQMTAAEYSRLFRITHGLSALRILGQLLSPFTPESRPQEETTWGKAIEEVIEAHPGWKYQDVYDLTISEWINARRRGMPISDDVPVPAGMDPREALAELRRAAYGTSEPAAKDRSAGNQNDTHCPPGP